MPVAPIQILGKNLLILASAGSGKTYQLGNRIIGLVAMGAAPESIVALTFTRKAAGEFADSVLTKLATAATDEPAATRLRADLGLTSADFADTLERVVRALPRFTLGTMDSFFSKVVRGFQYELGLSGGTFELLEGPRAEAAKEEILLQILGESMDAGTAGDFLHAFRRATMGREEQGVLRSLGGFVETWQGRYRTAASLTWGPEISHGIRVEDWQEQKHVLVAKILRGLDGIEFTDKRQRAALEKVIEALESHTIGSGSLSGSATGLMTGIFESAARDSGPFTLQHYKPFIIPGPAGEALRELVRLAACAETAAALHRTRAIREVVSHYDARREHQLRKRGLLGFDDVKYLMGEWARNEDSRLRREAVDFRLDARYQHWLLDEFQDTSPDDFTGLVPLLDEAAGEGEGSLFIVGDRKQAIYAWRGGDVGLFDEVTRKYEHGDLQIESMAESRRSCPQVLDLVNRVCSDSQTMEELFGDSANRWIWQDHVSAEPLAQSSRRGESRVEVLAKDKSGETDGFLERTARILEDLGIGKRAMTCGILVRSNNRVHEIADDLRARGFDVIEEGQREPAKDNPVGIALWQLLEWLADPANHFARETVLMSPLVGVLEKRFGSEWHKSWEGLHDEVSQHGFSSMLARIVSECPEIHSDFSHRRAGDLITALAIPDQGGITAREAADWAKRLTVSQSPGIAAVQVMTIHKSKGLGFDAVILPDIPTDSTPSAQRFEVAEGPGWLTSTPPKWARDLIPELRDAEERWGADQRYQDFCMLYVALTRAKRGLYVLLQQPAESARDLDRPSLANWLARSIGSAGETGVAFQSGNPDWVTTVGFTEPHPESVAATDLPPPMPRLGRSSPSSLEGTSSRHAPASPADRHFDTEIHRAFEKIGWIDGETPDLPRTVAGRRVAAALESPAIRPFFGKRGRSVRLLREQPIEAIVADRWLSAVIDRLHLHLDANGEVERVEIIDFKSDTVSNLADLASRYSDAMAAYRSAVALACPGALVECHLISLALLDSVSL